MPFKKPVSQGEVIRSSRFDNATGRKLENHGIERVPEIAKIRTSELADAYQHTTELINPLIERAEKALRALRLNVSASVDLETHEDWSSQLTFRKEDKEWRLLVDVGPDDDVEGVNWKSQPLITTSRELRLRALALLPALEKALVERVEKQMAEARETVATAAAYVVDLEARIK